MKALNEELNKIRKETRFTLKIKGEKWLLLKNQKKLEKRRAERGQLYQYLGRIAVTQSNFYEVQADYYHQLAVLSER